MDSKSGAFQRKGVPLRALSPINTSCLEPFWAYWVYAADLRTCIDS